MSAHMRIARPVSDLGRAVAMYELGLGFQELGHFENHDGFDGVMLGQPGMSFHFEFTYCRSHPIKPSPTSEDLLVFYVPEENEWEKSFAQMLQAGFKRVESFNPYWERLGRTYEDEDGYRIVIQQSEWGGAV